MSYADFAVFIEFVKRARRENFSFRKSAQDKALQMITEEDIYQGKLVSYVKAYYQLSPAYQKKGMR